MELKFIFDLDYTLYSESEIDKNNYYNSFKKKPLLNFLLKKIDNKYIFSNGNALHCQEVLQKMKIKSFFKKIATRDNYINFLKPHINSYNYVINNFNIKKNDIVIFFEDTLCNLERAKNYNWITVYIGNKINDRNKPSYVDLNFKNIECALFYILNKKNTKINKLIHKKKKFDYLKEK